MRWRDGVKAVIFDLDSTLIESRIDFGRMKRVALDELIRFGVDRSVLNERMTIMENIREGKGYLRDRWPSTNMDDVDRMINIQLTVTEMESVELVRPFDGVEEALRTLEEDGILMAILTRGSRAYTSRILELTGLKGRIGTYVCRDDYPLEEAKPNPVAMERAAGLLRSRPKECVYIGDHPMDLECARAAGAMFMGVLTGSTDREGWKRNGCITVLASVADLPLALGLASRQDADS